MSYTHHVAVVTIRDYDELVSYAYPQYEARIRLYRKDGRLWVEYGANRYRLGLFLSITRAGRLLRVVVDKFGVPALRRLDDCIVEKRRCSHARQFVRIRGGQLNGRQLLVS